MPAAKGLVQIYTGNGKGKTTAAIGQAIRAAGHDFKVCFICFFKNLGNCNTGEFRVMKKLGIKMFNFVPKCPHFYKKVDVKEIRKECLKAIEFVKTEIFQDSAIKLLVLDEINIALRNGYLKEKEVLTLLQEKPKRLEIILTGRGAPEAILRKADLASKIEKIKHPYDRGLKRRRGIEY